MIFYIAFVLFSYFGMSQVKKLVDEAMQQNNEDLVRTENERDAILKEIGNIVPDDVPVSDNEVCVSWVVWHHTTKCINPCTAGGVRGCQ